MADKTLPIYLSLEEAAEVMSLSVKTIRRRIADGTIPVSVAMKKSPLVANWKSPVLAR